MSTFSCPVVEFDLELHPNADALSIASIKETGWKCIVRTSDFANESLGVYIPIDAVASADHPLLGFLEGKRVKTIKLRKCISQGVLLPLSQVIACYSEVFENEIVDGAGIFPGDDLQHILGVKKYEQPVKPTKLQLGGGFNHELFHEVHDSFFSKYTDIENWNNYPDIIPEGELVVITEKLHGTSARFGLIDGQFYVGSKNRCLKLDFHKINESVWYEVFVKEELEKKLEELSALNKNCNVVLYGEIVGKGIQDLHYGHETPKLYAYDIRTSWWGKHPLDPLYHKQSEYEPFYIFKQECEQLNLDHVPLYTIKEFHNNDLLLRSGQDTINSVHIREGIVIEPYEPRFDSRIGRVILKYRGEEFDMRKGATDN